MHNAVEYGVNNNFSSLYNVPRAPLARLDVIITMYVFVFTFVEIRPPR